MHQHSPCASTERRGGGLIRAVACHKKGACSRDGVVYREGGGVIGGGVYFSPAPPTLLFPCSHFLRDFQFSRYEMHIAASVAPYRLPPRLTPNAQRLCESLHTTSNLLSRRPKSPRRGGGAPAPPPSVPLLGPLGPECGQEVNSFCCFPLKFCSNFSNSFFWRMFDSFGDDDLVFALVFEQVHHWWAINR